MAMFPFGGRSNMFDPFMADFWDQFEGPPHMTRNFWSLPSSVSHETAAVANTRVDWREMAEAHVFKVDLPGLKKEEVKVEVEDGTVLQISGERSREQEDKNDRWHRVERSSGKFLRRFKLPENSRMDQIKAAMDNGVLTVTVPKVAVNPPDLKTIEISG